MQYGNEWKRDRRDPGFYEKGGWSLSSEIKFLTIEDVADMLQVTRTTIYNLKKRGLPFIKLGKNIRFNQEDVVAWVMSNTHAVSNERK